MPSINLSLPLIAMRMLQKLQRYPKPKLPLAESICVSIAEPGYERCVAALASSTFAEIRLGQASLAPSEIKRINDPEKKLIATSRTDKTLLVHAIQSEVQMVDIELEALNRCKLVRLAKRNLTVKNLKDLVGKAETQGNLENFILVVGKRGGKRGRDLRSLARKRLKELE